MSHETDTPQPQVELEELARPEETLSAEQAEEVQGGFSAPNTVLAAPPEQPAGLLLPAVQKIREAANRI